MLWVIFATSVFVMLALDLGLLHREGHAVRFKEALAWTAAWFTLAFLFMWVVYFWRGPGKALEFLTGYLIEWSLSVDNIFVFLVIFSYFAVPAAYQHKVLFWGIVGAVIMRAMLITMGVVLIQQVEWIVYLFGAFLVFTGVRLLFQAGAEIHPERNPMLRLARRFLPITENYVRDKFFVRRGAQRFATPLLVVLLVVETTDIVFAVDSVPAVLAITTDPFIVYTSNVFAILGLRALYFVVAGIMQLFAYLRYGLSAILVFVGVKMLVADVMEIPVELALGVVASILLISIVASLFGSGNRVRSSTRRERAPARRE
ncbi:MAG: TerC family protein [Gemmatimonadetes bacterium]|nr:TerC family protein [Gemmatimonadota bacterium]